MFKAGHGTPIIGVNITQDLLTKSNLNISEVRSIEDLERPAKMKMGVMEQTEMYISSPVDCKDEKYRSTMER